MKKKRQKGFTLIETIMVMVIVGFIAAFLSTVIYGGINSWLFLKGQAGMMADTSNALRRMVREVRLTSDNNITAATTTEYAFTDKNNNAIDYKMVGTDLQRNGAVLLNNLSANGLIFNYLDNGGGVATSVNTVRTIQISIVAQNGNNRVRLQSAAAIRNK